MIPRCLLSALALSLLASFWAPPSAADERQAHEATGGLQAAEAEAAGGVTAEPAEKEEAESPDSSEDEAADGEPKLDLCAVPRSPEEAWLDRMQKGVFWTVCSTARWFDSFYGDSTDYQEYRATYGRFGVAAEYDEQDGTDLDTRFRARIELPNLERKIDAFVGRFDEDDFVEGRGDDFSALPRLFAETDTEWLLGLGYSPARDANSRFDVDGGVKVDFPMDPFVRARWRTHQPFGSHRLLRFSQTAFWRRSLGTGSTSHLDIERALGPKLLARWRTLGTVAEKIDGLEWRTSATLYQLLFEDSAIAYQIEGRGETDAEIPLDDWSAGLIYRQRMWREWFFLELRGRVHWPRDELHEKREAEAGFAIGFEILFGDHPSITRRHPAWDEVDDAVGKAVEEAKQQTEKAKQEKEKVEG